MTSNRNHTSSVSAAAAAAALSTMHCSNCGATSHSTTGFACLFCHKVFSGVKVNRLDPLLVLPFVEPILCYVCHERLQGPRYVESEGHQWHEDCFTCGVCGDVIVGPEFITNSIDGSMIPYHSECLQQDPGPCFKCDLPLNEWVLLAVGERWHPRCYSCNICFVPIGAFEEAEIDEKPAYCVGGGGSGAGAGAVHATCAQARRRGDPLPNEFIEAVWPAKGGGVYHARVVHATVGSNFIEVEFLGFSDAIQKIPRECVVASFSEDKEKEEEEEADNFSYSMEMQEHYHANDDDGGDFSSVKPVLQAGSLCRAIWSEDGLSYHARILEDICDENEVRVEWCGYGDVQRIPVSALITSTLPSSNKLNKIHSGPHKSEVKSWSSSEVNEWFQSLGLQTKYISAPLVTGSMLLEYPVFDIASAFGFSEDDSHTTKRSNSNVGEEEEQIIKEPIQSERLQKQQHQTESFVTHLLALRNTVACCHCTESFKSHSDAKCIKKEQPAYDSRGTKNIEHAANSAFNLSLSATTSATSIGGCSSLAEIQCLQSKHCMIKLASRVIVKHMLRLVLDYHAPLDVQNPLRLPEAFEPSECGLEYYRMVARPFANNNRSGAVSLFNPRTEEDTSAHLIVNVVDSLKTKQIEKRREELLSERKKSARRLSYISVNSSICSSISTPLLPITNKSQTANNEVALSNRKRNFDSDDQQKQQNEEQNYNVRFSGAGGRFIPSDVTSLEVAKVKAHTTLFHEPPCQPLPFIARPELYGSTPFLNLNEFYSSAQSSSPTNAVRRLKHFELERTQKRDALKRELEFPSYIKNASSHKTVFDEQKLQNVAFHHSSLGDANDKQTVHQSLKKLVTLSTPLLSCAKKADYLLPEVLTAAGLKPQPRCLGGIRQTAAALPLVFRPPELPASPFRQNHYQPKLDFAVDYGRVSRERATLLEKEKQRKEHDAAALMLSPKIGEID